jgi:hypothetical protein
MPDCICITKTNKNTSITLSNGKLVPAPQGTKLCIRVVYENQSNVLAWLDANGNPLPDDTADDKLLVGTVLNSDYVPCPDEVTNEDEE